MRGAVTFLIAEQSNSLTLATYLRILFSFAKEGRLHMHSSHTAWCTGTGDTPIIPELEEA